MPGIYYFFPGKTGANPDHFAKAGIGELLGTPGKEQGPTFFETPGSGPNGSGGVVAYWPVSLDQMPLAFKPELQDWHDAGPVWLGRDKGQPVTPESLQRSKRHQGRDVVLADGQSWHVPIARQLPHLLGIGKPRIHDLYKPFWERSVKALDWLGVTDDGVIWDIPWNDENSEGFQFACAALAVNYRVCPLVADWLGLFTADEVCRILETVTGDDCIRRMFELEQKKSAQPILSANLQPSDAGAAA